MKVVRLKIQNFRGIAKATFHFEGHALLTGPNNIGKSTIFEALDLALGLDRLKRVPPVEEYDFHEARYIDTSAEPPAPVPIEIEVVLADLNEEVARFCFDRLERWHKREQRLLDDGEIELADDPDVQECLRVRAVGSYNPSEDEFEAASYFCSGPATEFGFPPVPRHVRQQFGYFFLRALRTGSRALSLERGSLLDVVLRTRQVRMGLWETAIDRLRNLDPAIDESAEGLSPILESIEARLAEYVEVATTEKATPLYVSQLTREHLRKTVSFFLRSTTGAQAPIPFQLSGTGTLSILVFALLSLLAELHRSNVIFAMEEPEIALPPHTQRRVVRYLLQSATQALVTSHSPYVLECFEPSQVQVLRREADATVVGRRLPVGAALKGKTYKRHARRGLAEAILGRAVIVCEGITEKEILQAAAEKMEESSDSNYPLDLSGVSVLSVDGDGSLPEFGAFFKALGLRTYGFYDKKARSKDEEEKLELTFDLPFESSYVGAERLLVEECPAKRLSQLLRQLSESGLEPGLIAPADDVEVDALKGAAFNLLRSRKGSGYARRLIELCEQDEVPGDVIAFLSVVYAEFERPREPLPLIDESDEKGNPSPSQI